MAKRKAIDDRPIVRTCRACQAEIPKTETAYLVEIEGEWGPWCESCIETRDPSARER